MVSLNIKRCVVRHSLQKSQRFVEWARHRNSIYGGGGLTDTERMQIFNKAYARVNNVPVVQKCLLYLHVDTSI